MARTRRRLVLLCIILVLVAVASLQPMMAAAAAFLTGQDPPEKCDAAVVLTGEENEGWRLKEAERLYRAGWVGKIVLSGGRLPFGLHETDLSLPLALEMGLPRQDLLPIPSRTFDSWSEAQALVPELEKAGFRCVILVSSEPDSRRLRVTYRKLAPKMRVLMRTVPDPRFSAASWWYTREGQKSFFYGWTSLVRTWFR